MEKIPDLHHVTAIASEPQRNLDFHNGPLRLRFVKRTVNFDDPRSYHFYFGDMVLLTPDTLPDLSSVRVWIGAGDQDPFVFPHPRRNAWQNSFVAQARTCQLVSQRQGMA